jgi:predicted CoA-binding protein
VSDQFCEFPQANADTEEIDVILEESTTVAIVGLSDRADRDSNEVARFLQRHGFRIVPVNPGVAEILGEVSYPDLSSIPADIDIDIVDIFRKPEFIPAIVDDAIARGARTIWMQRGLAHNAAAAAARAAGLKVVMDRCIKVELSRLRG